MIHDPRDPAKVADRIEVQVIGDVLENLDGHFVQRGATVIIAFRSNVGVRSWIDHVGQDCDSDAKFEPDAGRRRLEVGAEKRLRRVDEERVGEARWSGGLCTVGCNF